MNNPVKWGTGQSAGACGRRQTLAHLTDPERRLQGQGTVYFSLIRHATAQETSDPGDRECGNLFKVKESSSVYS